MTLKNYLPFTQHMQTKNEPKTIYRTSKTKTIYLNTDTAIYFNIISRKTLQLHHIPKYVILCKKLCDFLQTLNWRNCCALWSTELKPLGKIFMKSDSNFPYFVSKGPSLCKDSYRNGWNTPTLIFEDLKPVEISKNHFNIIWTSSKVVLIFKIRRQRFKN